MMIQETCLRITELQERAEADRQARYARRNKIRRIDELINEFEMLNLADEVEIPRDLRFRVIRFIQEEAHPLAKRPLEDVGIADWMEALYELQDALMVPVEDELD